MLIPVLSRREQLTDPITGQVADLKEKVIGDSDTRKSVDIVCQGSGQTIAMSKNRRCVFSFLFLYQKTASKRKKIVSYAFSRSWKGIQNLIRGGLSKHLLIIIPKILIRVIDQGQSPQIRASHTPQVLILVWIRNPPHMKNLIGRLEFGWESFNIIDWVTIRQTQNH